MILKFYPKNIFGKCGFKIYLKTVFSKYGFRRENLVIRKEDSFNNNFLKKSIHFLKKKYNFFGTKLNDRCIVILNR